MALVDIYNIENWSAGEPTPWYIRVLPLVGTLLGFLLGLLPGLISRIKDKYRTGRLFKQEVAALIVTLDEQIKEIQRYRSELLNPTLKQSELSGLNIFLTNTLEVIKVLDKITLIKYFEKEEKEFSTLYISSRYQMFGIIQKDAERLERAYVEYQIEFDKISESYFQEINSLRTLAIIERDKLKGDMSKDKVLTKLWEIAFSEKPNFSIDAIMTFAKELHPKLLRDEIFTEVSHPMYKPILDFAVSGIKIVNLYENKKTKYLSILRMSEQTFQSAYDDLTAGISTDQTKSSDIAHNV
jgi:hypothetical protein